MRIIFYIVLIYLLYKFIFEFLIPVAKVAGQMKSAMKNMPQQSPFSSTTSTASQAEQPKQEPSKPNDDEYIEFEEIK